MSYWYGGLTQNLDMILILMYEKRMNIQKLRKLMGFAGILGPYSTKAELERQIRLGSMKIKIRDQQRMQRNPKMRHVDTSGAVEIYENIHAIEAKKGKHSLWPHENFRHDFKGTRTKIYGLKNGNILIVGKKKLWKNFQYSEKDV